MLAYADGVGTHEHVVGSSEWFRWLGTAQATSFRFEHELASFTARRERQSNGAYWYAYRKSRGRLIKLYLGSCGSPSKPATNLGGSSNGGSSRGRR